MKPRIPDRFRRFPFWNSKEPNSQLCEMDNYEDYAKRIQKTLYYGKLPSTDRPSLPVTDILVQKFGKICKPNGFEKLKIHEASSICYDACVTPCSVIVALLYLDRLRTHNPEYLASTSPSQVFVVALMVASKYLYDDGEEDEVYNHEWATSAAMMLSDLNEAEKNFLSAIEWNLFVDMKTFMDGLMVVESVVAKQQGTSRGFFVYSDMICILNTLPSAWTAFIHLVGSAIAVCIITYTATVFVVITGTLTTKQLADHMAIRVTQNKQDFLPSVQFNDSCRCQSVDDYENIIDMISAEEENLGKEEEEDEDWLESNSSFSRKFNALQTLTTALLLASSKFLETPMKEFAGENLSHSFHYATPSSAVFRDEQTVKEFLPYYGIPANFYSNQNFISADSVPTERPVSSRKWRKPTRRSRDVHEMKDKRIRSKDDPQTSSLSFGIEESKLADVNEEISGHGNSYDEFDYFRSAIGDEGNVRHPRLPSDLFPKPSSTFMIPLYNSTSLAAKTSPSCETHPHDHFSGFLVAKEIILPNAPKFPPVSTLSSLLSPYHFLLKLPHEMEWFTEKLITLES